MEAKPLPIRWTKDSFTVLDARQTIASARVTRRKFPSSWIVINRREPDQQYWYVFSSLEFDTWISNVADDVHLIDALRLHEYTSSYKATKRSDKSTAQLNIQHPTVNRAVLINQRTNAIAAIGHMVDVGAAIGLTSDLFGTQAELGPAADLSPKPRKSVKKSSKRSAKKAAKKAGGFTETEAPSGQKLKAFDVVQVMFATDREVESTRPGSAEFSNQRSSNGELRYGICEISIPPSHKIGVLESPSILHLQLRCDPNLHISLLRSDILPESNFLAQVNDLIRKSPRREAFVFVHGYNVSFEDAARRTGQIARDLKFQGAPILYSWPSRASLFSYSADEATVEVSAVRFAEFLRKLAQSAGASVLHIIAHSMGNRAVLLGLERLAREADPPKLNNVILTAPDIDVERFYQIADSIENYPVRTTLYASSKDKALRESQRLHRFPRAGESGKSIVIAKGVDTVDASLVDTNLFSLGHSYFGTKRTVLSDISDVLDGKQPDSRFQLREQKSPLGRYWAFRP